MKRLFVAFVLVAISMQLVVGYPFPEQLEPSERCCDEEGMDNWCKVRHQGFADNIDKLPDLSGRRLTELSVAGSNLGDINQLKNSEFWDLDLSATKVTDLSPLAKSNSVMSLDISDTEVTDISSLGKITYFDWLKFDPKRVVRGIDILRDKENMRMINKYSPEEFWQRYDSGERVILKKDKPYSVEGRKPDPFGAGDPFE